MAEHGWGFAILFTLLQSLPESAFSTGSSGWSLGFFNAGNDRKPFDILYWGFLGLAAGRFGELFAGTIKNLGESCRQVPAFRQVGAFFTRNVRQLFRFPADD